MSYTPEQLAKFMEEDGHAGCAQDFLIAVDRKTVQEQVEIAYEIADCYEGDPDGYDDDFAIPMPAILREWADSQEE
jgi:hypothetical protein